MAKSKISDIADRTKDYLSSAARNFAGSFRNLGRTITYITAYKLLFYAFCIFATLKFRDIIIGRGESLMQIDPAILRAGPSPELAALSASIKGFYSQIIAYIAILALLILAAYIITNFLIWALITGRKLRKAKRSFALRFALLNALWIAGWAALAVLLVSSLRPEVIMRWLLGITLVYCHFTAVMYIAYFMREKAVKAFRKAFDVGVTKVHHFIVPYFFAFVIFMLLNKILSPFQNLNFVMTNPDAATIIGFVIFLFYGAWLKIYIYSFAKKLV